MSACQITALIILLFLCHQIDGWKWKRFKHYRIISGLNKQSAEEQVIYIMGEKQRIYIFNSFDLSGEEEGKFETVLEWLNGHFVIKRNTIYLGADHAVIPAVVQETLLKNTSIVKADEVLGEPEHTKRYKKISRRNSIFKEKIFVLKRLQTYLLRQPVLKASIIPNLKILLF